MKDTVARRMRLRGLMKKEALQILRDPSSIAIAIVLPLVLLFIFGYGVSLDASHVPVAVVVESPSPETASFTSALYRSEYFEPVVFQDMPAAEAAMMDGRVLAVVWMRQDFPRKLLSGEGASIGVLINGVDANNGRMIKGYLQGVWSGWLERYARSKGQLPDAPVSVEQRIWFNPEVRSRDYIVPGLIAIIMTLIGTLLTAMVVAREWERGTMEALMVTPVEVREILLGKIVPYFCLGIGGLMTSVAMAVWLFDVPLRGSMWVLVLTSSLFLVVALAMGLLISTVAKSQFVAGQLALVVTFLPAFILSGFIFDIGSMPEFMQYFTHIIAARYFVSILQTVFLAGDVGAVIIANSIALVVMAVVFLTLVRRRTRKRLA